MTATKIPGGVMDTGTHGVLPDAAATTPVRTGLRGLHAHVAVASLPGGRANETCEEINKLSPSAIWGRTCEGGVLYCMT